MARILCAYSGIEFTCEHFPAYLTARECAHPIFSLSLKKLLPYQLKYECGELTPTDSYLLFLALLNSSSCVEFRVPANRNPATDAIIANNMSDLFSIISKVVGIKSPHFAVPSFVISPDTKTLETVHYWIAAWENCIDDFESGYTTAHHRRKQEDKEYYLEKLIKGGEKETSQYSSSLAEWAALAGNFPTGTVPTIFGVVSLSDYWKKIIRKCTSGESIFQIPLLDLEDLIEHCEDSIDAGSIYAHALFKLLREGRERHKNFLGLGEFSIIGESYKILADDDSVEDANKLMMIESAPDKEPIAADYPNRISYLKAKTKWTMKVEYLKQNPPKQEPKSSDDSNLNESNGYEGDIL